MKERKTNVNLASRPLRNRRFFFTLMSLIAAVFLCLAVLSTLSFFKDRAREAAARGSLSQIRRMTQAAQREKDAWTAQIRDLSRTDKEKIDSINGIILRKSFSWVDFFSRLEDALPATSYISWFAPLQAGEGKLDVRVRVVSRSLEDLLTFIQKLNALGFKDISVKNETPFAGQLNSEIMFSHERTF